MKAPQFELLDQNGMTRKLSDFAGKWVVVYFYPKDDTPGCTVEACNFRDTYHQLENLGVVVLGISKDSVKSHEKFAKKYDLNFPILSDESTNTIKAYGAWGVKSFMGRKFEGINRKSYLIDPAGEIRKEYDKVIPIKHASEIIDDVEIFLK